MDVTIHFSDDRPARLIVTKRSWELHLPSYEVSDMTDGVKRVIENNLEFDEALRLLFSEIKTIRQDKY